MRAAITFDRVPEEKPVSYNAVTRQIVDPVRPNFIVAGRGNMVHAVMMLHHRIPWSMLRINVMNRVLAGTLDTPILNALLSLSPADSGPLISNFKSALTQVLARKTLTLNQVDAIEAVEQELFSLPCNLFLGLNARADDPGDEMDFTPDDVGYDGAYAAGAVGDLQKLRETLYGQLSKATIDIPMVKGTSRKLADAWKKNPPAIPAPAPVPALEPLAIGTGSNNAWWAPGAVPHTVPAYRHWIKPAVAAAAPVALTSAECLELNTRVAARAKKLGSS